MRVYLGGSKGKWREQFQKRFPNWNCYDPFKQSKQSCLALFTIEDLKAINESDIVFFVINYEDYTGSCIEAGYAYAFDKPIILVFLLKDKLPSMFTAISRRVFTDFEKSLEWVERGFRSK